MKNKPKIYIKGLIAVSKIKRAKKKNIPPKNSRKLYSDIKKAGMINRA